MSKGSINSALPTKQSLVRPESHLPMIPPRRDITTNDPLSNGILEQTYHAIPMPTIPQMNTYWSAMGSAYSGIWDGDDVKTDLNTAAAAMDAAK